MQDETQKRNERQVARDSTENFLGTIDFGRYETAKGRVYLKEVLVKDLEVLSTFMTRKILTDEDKKNLIKDVGKLINSREKVIQNKADEDDKYPVVRIPGSSDHNLCIKFDIGGVGAEISPEIHFLMDTIAPDIKEKSGNIPATMVWIDVADKEKVIDSSLHFEFTKKLDSITPDYHPKMNVYQL